MTTCTHQCRTLLASTIFAVGATGSIAAACGDYLGMFAPAEPARQIDLAICLDTSGSMDGLIDSAKQKLWAIVNDLALADPAPTLRVSLLTFGNDGHLAEDGWVKVHAEFTDDLDLVSRELFALRTNGGTEFVGRALHRAGGLDWHPSADGLKLIVVAGNESADQDQQTTVASVCPTLIARGIMVNSIYCGPDTDDSATGWKQVSVLADGHFASIDQTDGTVVIETPFDEELGALSTSLNATYLPYGERGEWGCSNQLAQDQNASGLNAAAAAARCSTKASTLYTNPSWDLVDASQDKEFDLDGVDEKSLPEAMQSMSPEERRAFVAAKAGERAALQERIAVISEQRASFIDEAMKKQGLEDGNAFDRVVRQAIRDQAMASGFRFTK